ncbi:MAG: 3-deoxy-D-manno-octulosonic acid transferase, partial [Pseudomonadota bacterium]|nr:3-deoxy-D-manno-octulosonic acid transferase [Pseudomonadota bacterium]
GSIWVHAVSLGETRASSALIDALRERRPEMRLLLTHGTATGHDAGAALLQPGDHQTWLPVDTPGATRRFFARFRPAIGVLMETEVWPNLILAARRAGVPVVLANARLSERSFRRGRRIRALLQPAIDSVALALAQSADDAARMRASGARAVEVCGNLKYDLTPDARQLALGRAWRAQVDRDVVVAAVTREGEEARLLAEWTRAPRGPTLLVIVPRHPQRFDDVAALIRAAGLTLARRSAWGDEPPAQALAAEVWLGDSMGEMPLYYGLARVALLGGSFAPFGGHNLIEAAACGCPLVMGPSTFNFSDAARRSLAAQASVQVADMREGVSTATVLLREPEALAELSAHAVQFAGAHRGAAHRMALRILALIPARQSEPGTN